MNADTLKATHFINKNNSFIKEFAANHAGVGTERMRAVNLYYAVRDSVAYDLRAFTLEKSCFVASNVLQAQSAFCVPKAVALAAVARAVGIPSLIGFANVRNHLTSRRVTSLMDDDIFRWHAYTALHIDGRWVKATPAFDIGLCRRHGVKPLDFDGREDSIFHEFNTEGRRHMEYIDFIGEFPDMPFDAFSSEMRLHYQRLLEGMEQDRQKARLRQP